MESFAFRGGPVLKLDEKSRLTVPATYKDQLLRSAGGRMVVAKNHDRCLSLFPQPVWQKFEVYLNSLPDEYAGWRRLYCGSATDVQIDGGSRVLVPPELRDWAGLQKNVVFMGVGPYFELWDTARLADAENKLLSQPRPPALASMGWA